MKKINRGQFSYDYFISMVIFILFMVYILFQIMAMKPIYLNEVRNEIMRSEAYQLSEILVNDPGEPMNWNAVNVKRIGLSSEITNKTNYLSVAKISTLASLCPQAGYSSSFRNNFGIDSKYTFSIIVRNITSGLSLADCHSTLKIAPKAMNVSIKRVVTFDSGGYGEIVVQMW
jgi:hypothetical protein